MRTVRLSQTISPFGVGAIFDVVGESLMGVDISEWYYKRTVRVDSPRLERALGVHDLRSPPSVPAWPSQRTPGIPYQRFPAWLFCPECRAIHRSTESGEKGTRPDCPACNTGLVPMRFIAVCVDRSHAMDVPWPRWAHSRAKNEDQRRCRESRLTFDTRTGGSEGLSSLVVRCRTCKAERHLGDLMTRDSLHRIGVQCQGRQPWQRGERAVCDSRLEVLQRGATNVTYPETTTALDIPEPARPVRDVEAEIRQHRNFEDVRSAPDGPRAPALIGLIAEDLGVPEDLVRAVATREETDMLAVARQNLLSDEWSAFRAVLVEGSTGSRNFLVSGADLLDDSALSVHDLLAERVGQVVLVHRLREIRVLHGFRRYTPTASMVSVDLGRRGRQRWLPAVESFGEGIFFSLDEPQLTAWERLATVERRVGLLERRVRDNDMSARFPDVSPRLVLLHTLAHLMMRRLAFTCGYSAASLRERVYAATEPEPHAGVLIYTAAGDSEGTLGGLVRQGKPPRLARMFLEVLEDASWCSADPVCAESRGQGPRAVNLAACHGCCLVSETSCERSNLLLDRVLLIGDHDTRGYFEEVIADLRKQLG
jgi:hypothetical protein